MGTGTRHYRPCSDAVPSSRTPLFEMDAHGPEKRKVVRVGAVRGGQRSRGGRRHRQHRPLCRDAPDFAESGQYSAMCEAVALCFFVGSPSWSTSLPSVRYRCSARSAREDFWRTNSVREKPRRNVCCRETNSRVCRCGNKSAVAVARKQAAVDTAD